MGFNLAFKGLSCKSQQKYYLYATSANFVCIDPFVNLFTVN